MQSDFMLKEAEKAVRNDLRNPKVPECLQWTFENVADFIKVIIWKTNSRRTLKKTKIISTNKFNIFIYSKEDKSNIKKKYRKK